MRSLACWGRFDAVQITEVRKPNVGEAKPAAVTANVVIDTRPLRGDVRAGEEGRGARVELFNHQAIRPEHGCTHVVVCACSGATLDFAMEERRVPLVWIPMDFLWCPRQQP